jgi:hypothetical protein
MNKDFLGISSLA